MSGLEKPTSLIDADEPKNERKNTRRAQVLDAAAKCFVDFGFHNASMSRIAGEAKMSVGHIYHYFDNKDAIIAAIVERDMQEAVARFEDFCDVAPEDFAQELITRMDQAIEKKTDLFYTGLVLEILAESRRSQAISRIVQTQDQFLRRRFAEILEDKTGLTDGETRVEALFTLMGGLTDRISRHPDLNPNKLRPYLRAAIHAILEP